MKDLTLGKLNMVFRQNESQSHVFRKDAAKTGAWRNDPCDSVTQHPPNRRRSHRIYRRSHRMYRQKGDRTAGNDAKGSVASTSFSIGSGETALFAAGALRRSSECA